jgi:hypothetical protein
MTASQKFLACARLPADAVSLPAHAILPPRGRHGAFSFTAL